MTISLAIAGKPNSGKSTFFKATSLANVEIANYPFTTIDANQGVSYVRVTCPCTELKERCGNCQDGIRFVPVTMIDVAGLVPDAHKGKGLGNEFLDHLRRARAIIHIIDASGGTDIEGNVVPTGSHEPTEDVEFLEHEITMWMHGVLMRKWDQISKRAQISGSKLELEIAEQMAGTGVDDAQVKNAIAHLSLDKEKPTKWSEEDLLKLSDTLRRESKPLMLVANKMDIAPLENTEKLGKMQRIMTPASAEAELALRMAAKNNIIKYLPGDATFEIISDGVNQAQKDGLEKIRELMNVHGGTGVQQGINTAVFELLQQIVVYPVEDEGKMADSKGNVLPDAYLMDKGSTPHDLAYMVHTDIGDSFLYAVDARSKMRLGEKHELKNGDVVKIVSTK